MNAREKLAFAADLPLDEAERLYRQISERIGWVKVGLSLFVEHGPRAVVPFQRLGAKVFLDLKLHDIPNTVALAAEKAASLGVNLLTVHASGGPAMLQAAVKGAALGAQKAGCVAPKILAVTVLTSMDANELHSVGVPRSPPEQVMTLATMAQKSGVDGFVCSAQEASSLRKSFGPSLFLCTPGIRPKGAAAMDQSRIETPATAIRQGANLLVVGRPLYASADPVVAATQLWSEVSAA